MVVYQELEVFLIEIAKLNNSCIDCKNIQIIVENFQKLILKSRGKDNRMVSKNRAQQNGKYLISLYLIEKREPSDCIFLLKVVGITLILSCKSAAHAIKRQPLCRLKYQFENFLRSQ